MVCQFFFFPLRDGFLIYYSTPFDRLIKLPSILKLSMKHIVLKLKPVVKFNNM